MTNVTNWDAGDPHVPAGFETWGQAISADVDVWTTGSTASPMSPHNAQAPYFLPEVLDGSSNNFPLGERVYYAPVLLRQAARFADISTYISTAVASTQARLGIYGIDTDGLPGALVIDGGTVSTATTGAKTITLDEDVSAGWYYLAFIIDSASVGVRTWKTYAGKVRDSFTQDGQEIVLISEFGASPTPAAATAFPDPAVPVDFYGGDGCPVFVSLEATP